MSSPDKGKRQCPFVLYCFTSAVPSTPGGSLNYDDVFFYGSLFEKIWYTRPIRWSNFTRSVEENRVTNRALNIRLHSLSQIFKGWTEVRIDVPASYHNIIPENKQFYQQYFNWSPISFSILNPGMLFSYGVTSASWVKNCSNLRFFRFIYPFWA